MGISLSLFGDPDGQDPIDEITLGEISVGTDFAHGEPRRIFAVNSGDTHLRDIAIAATGEGAQFIQFARDEDGKPGVWAAVGEGIIAHNGTLFMGDGFAFWTRGNFSFDDREGVYPLEFVLKGTSIG